MEIEKLCGKSLDGFSIRELTEVFMADRDGRRLSTCPADFFQDSNVAEAFAKDLTRAQNTGSPHLPKPSDPSAYSNYLTRKVFALTNGEVGFLIGDCVAELLGSEQAALKIKKVALSKLTPAERKVLGVSLGA
jgi:hypothetical protein